MIKLTEQVSITMFDIELPIIYGYGAWGKSCLRYLRQKGVDIRGVCDQRWKEYSEKVNETW